MTEAGQPSLSMEMIGQALRAEISGAAKKRDSGLLEDALEHALALHCPLSVYLDLACDLVGEDWHISHEWLIGLIQEEEDPRAVPFLKKAIDLKPRLRYLDYDDYGAYYKKCLWALAALGTPEAIAVIRDCADSDIEVLSHEARYRLTKVGP